MACFVVPMTEAIVVSVVKKAAQKKEAKMAECERLPKTAKDLSRMHISWSRKLSWLNRMLWGGVLLLVIEHVWHGEVVPWPPFLTSMSNLRDMIAAFYEMASIGTSMAVFVTLVWVVMIVAADWYLNRLSLQAQKVG